MDLHWFLAALYNMLDIHLFKHVQTSMEPHHEQSGVSILPKDTMKCRQQQSEINQSEDENAVHEGIVVNYGLQI